jgi:hypothetical protein
MPTNRIIFGKFGASGCCVSFKLPLAPPLLLSNLGNVLITVVEQGQAQVRPG